MSYRNYDNSYSPRFTSVINDGATTSPEQVTGNRVVVLGFARVAKIDGELGVPTQELFPSRPGTVSIDDLIVLTQNVSVDEKPIKYPSEVSIKLEQLRAKGITNVQVIILGEDDRLFDASARMARERFICLETAYDQVTDLVIDELCPCNVVLGLKGDGLYNASTQEVIYDVAAAGEIGADLSLSNINGFVVATDADYEKTPVSEPEDLAYQLATACFKISAGGTVCTAGLSTLNPLQVKYLQELDLVSAPKQGVTYGGAAATKIGANAWGLFDSTYFDGWDFAVTHVAVDGDEVMYDIESIAYPTDKNRESTTWNNGSTSLIKPSILSTTKPSTPLTEASSATSPASTAKDLVQWQLLFGSPTPSELNNWVKFLKNFGSGTDTIYKGSVASYKAWDGVSADSDGQPKSYRYYATTDGEMPLSSVDSTVITDANGRAMDVGIYLNVHAACSRYAGPAVVLLDRANGISRSILTSGDTEYIGMSNSLANNVAHTRQEVTTVTSLAFIGSRAVSALTRLRYICYKEEDGVYIVNRDITGGLYVSENVRTDMINRITLRVIKNFMNVCRLEGKPLLGTLGNPVRIEGFKQKLEQEFGKWVHPEDGRLTAIPSIKVFSTLTGKIYGKIRVTGGLSVAGEILEVEAQATIQ